MKLITAFFRLWILLIGGPSLASELPVEITLEEDMVISPDDVMYQRHLAEYFDPEFPFFDDPNLKSLNQIELRVQRDDYFALDWDSHKDKTRIWSSDGTLASFHYLVLPMWYRDESPQEPYDKTVVESTLDETVQYYTNMSWGKHQLSFEFLPQVQLNLTIVNPTLNEAKAEARTHVESLGRVLGADHDGVVLLYARANSGDMANGGGWGSINGGFTWMNFPTGFRVTRHEVGHNYGHPHHKTGGYAWRYNGNSLDGFDMMSGGNGYDVSDLTAAAKVLFNWIPSEAVVTMHPEGSTTLCPQCSSEESDLVLHAFDNPGLPPASNRKMAVHIPVFRKGNTLYSYWLSYRGFGNDGKAASGLSIHAIWYRFCNGCQFAATFDSLNYDAFGDTLTTMDSFVLPNTCYLITPSLKLMKEDPSMTEDNQPIVCVDSVDNGNSITISVSFLDTDITPTSQIALGSEIEAECSSGGIVADFDMANGNHHLLHYIGTGSDGTVDFSACISAGSQAGAKAFFYDSYPPYLLLDEKYSTAIEYGSFMSLDIVESCDSSSTAEYISAGFGDAYVLVVPISSDPTSVSVSSSCTFNSCLPNHYMDNGACEQCPIGFVSLAGSVSAADCFDCMQYGADPIHFAYPDCLLPDDPVKGAPSGKSWRLLTNSDLTERWWGWDVRRIQFFETSDCSGIPLDTSDAAQAFDSGNAGDSYGPYRAFQDNNLIWGGRRDAYRVFFVGYTFPSDRTVRCMNLEQTSAFTKKIFVQVYDEDHTDWTNVWIQDNLSGEPSTIRFENDPSESPTPSPTPPTPSPTPPTPPTPSPTPPTPPTPSPSPTPPTPSPTPPTPSPTPPTPSPTLPTPSPTPLEQEPDDGGNGGNDEEGSCGIFALIIQLVLGWLLGIFGMKFC